MKKSPVSAIRLAVSLAIGFMVWISLISQTLGAVVYVDPNGSIQAAIDSAAHGDVIILHPGTYHENINSGGKAITLRSTDPNDPAAVEATVIDGGGTGRVITFDHGEGSSTILSGLTITNGRASEGAGIHCSLNSSPTISRCVITGNIATSQGGGIYGHDSSPAISQCTISGNTSSGYDGEDGGAGIYCYQSASAITNCTITGNSSSQDGGGIYCKSSSSVTINGCRITGNSGGLGGGIFLVSSSPAITDCTISGNTAKYDGGGIACSPFSSPTITNCTISDNTAGHYGGGGGIYCSYSSPAIIYCTISGNIAYQGGGISCSPSSSPAITSCIISSNTTGHYGGGIYCFSSSPLITNCTISNNTADDNGGGIYCWSSPSPKVISSILWGDLAGGAPNEIYENGGATTVTYSDIQGGYTGEGNIEADPLFVDPNGGDYHLRPNSPCIDAGGDPDSTTNEDRDGIMRPLDGNGDGISVVDMGAYEYNISQEITFELNLPKSWSMISLPVEPSDRRVKVLFSEAQAVFGYSGQNAEYTPLDPNSALEAGEGYWIYLPEEKTYSLTGSPIYHFEIPAAKGGWSMIGAGTYPSHPSLENGDIVAIFGFSGKYVFLSPEDPLEPGRGYWINLSGPTVLRVETGN